MYRARIRAPEAPALKLTTVGYGDVYPVTASGKIFAGIAVIRPVWAAGRGAAADGTVGGVRASG